MDKVVENGVISRAFVEIDQEQKILNLLFKDRESANGRELWIRFETDDILDKRVSFIIEEVALIM